MDNSTAAEQSDICEFSEHEESSGDMMTTSNSQMGISSQYIVCLKCKKILAMAIRGYAIHASTELRQ